MNSAKFINPHGGLMVWIFIFAELITFGLFFITYLYHQSTNTDLFIQSKELLNVNIGLINTIVLITSSYFVFLSAQYVKSNNQKLASILLLIALIFGFSFIGIKSYEYYSKFQENITLSTNLFFSYYWLLTLLHLLHVILGVIILSYVLIMTLKGKYTEDKMGFHTGAMYWHMCDLIWVILFPLLYLLK